MAVRINDEPALLDRPIFFSTRATPSQGVHLINGRPFLSPRLLTALLHVTCVYGWGYTAFEGSIPTIRAGKWTVKAQVPLVLSLLCKRDAGRICIECAIHLRRVRAFSSLIDVETFSQELLHGIPNCSLVRIIRNTFRNTDGLIYRRDDGNGRNRRWEPSMREKFRSYFFFTAGHWSLFKRLVESDTDWYESKDMISDELTRFDPSGDTFIPLVD